MSVNFKYSLFLYFLLFPIFIFSQDKNSEHLFLQIDKNKIKFNEDGSVSFRIYRRGYEKETSRDSLLNLYKNKNVKDIKDITKINPDKLANTGKIPQMYFDFYSIEIPVIFKEVDTIKLIDENEFRKNESLYLYDNKKYLVFRDLENIFYICEVFLPEYE